MALYYDFDSYPQNIPTVVTVGSFDGVHGGHHRLLDRVISMAQRLSARSVVVSFEPHPRIAMGRAEGMSLLTNVEERVELLTRLGIDDVVIAHFDDKFRMQSYEEFVQRSLVDAISMRGMVVGYNHRFGREHTGNYDSLMPLARQLGFEVEQVEQFRDRGDKVSSTVIRELIAKGDMARATEMLQHPYMAIGEARSGVVPIRDSYKLLPAGGDYRAMVNREETLVSVLEREIRLAEVVDGRVVIEFLERL